MSAAIRTALREIHPEDTEPQVPWRQAPDYPDLHAVVKALRSAMRREGTGGLEIKAFERKPNILSSSLHSEILVCHLADGRRRQVFYKHSATPPDGHPAKRGVSYEATVYRDVLRPLPVSQAHFYGAHANPRTGESWLFIEFLDRAPRVSATSYPDPTEQAARWLGGFHRAIEARAADESLSFLERYDRKYYRGWAERTQDIAGRFRQRRHWLADLCKGFGEAASLLLEPPLTVIHGEFTPHNVLIRR